MTAKAMPPLKRRLQQRLFHIVNVPMRAVLALPLATPLSGRLMLVFLTGRRTGKSYRQPVSYVRDGDVLLTPGGGNWKLKLREGRPERIRLGGHDVLARPEIIGDAAEIERLLGIITAANPMAGRFVAIQRQADRTLDRASLDAAIRHGFRIIGWQPDAEQVPGAGPLRARGARPAWGLRLFKPTVAGAGSATLAIPHPSKPRTRC